MEGLSEDEKIQAAIAARHQRAQEIGAQRAEQAEAKRPHFANPNEFGGAIIRSARVDHAHEVATNTSALDNIDRMLEENRTALLGLLDHAS